MLQSEVAYRAYYAMYNKFMDTRFETNEAALAAADAVFAQLAVYTAACDAEDKAAWAAEATNASM